MGTLVLTDEQQELVDLVDGCYLVVAPPGSGKTEVIAHRILRLLQRTEDSGENILALSFTKNAAAAMRRRVAGLLSEEPRRVTFTNFHAFCHDALVHYGHLIGLPQPLTVYETPDDRLQALRQGLVDSGFLDASADIARADGQRCLEEIGRLKRALLLPAAAPDGPVLLGVPLNELYGAYDLALTTNGAVDFDTILLKAYQLFTHQAGVAEHYRAIYGYILVDEAQDTSLIQYEILRTICGLEHRNVFMVADPAQSVYGFTGASPKHVESFVRDFEAQRRVLSKTFRCGQRITEVAKNLAKTAGRKWADSLSTTSPSPGLVMFEEASNEPAEAVATVDWAVDLLTHGLPRRAIAADESPNVNAEQIAVLGRNRQHLQAVVAELERRQLPYHFSAGDSGAFESDEYRLLMYCLKVLSNPRDAAIVASLLAAASRLRQDLTLPDSISASDLPALFSSLSDSFGDSSVGPLFVACRDDVIAGDVDRTVDAMLEWAPHGVGELPSDQLLDNDYDFLRDRVIAFRATTPPGARTWAGLAMELGSTPKPEAPGIRVLTVHAAKGLEFSAVNVVGLNDGAFPDFRSASGEALESERRLIYVAMTRASRVLRLSRPRAKMTRFGPRAVDRSQFIAEAGVD